MKGDEGVKLREVMTDLALLGGPFWNNYWSV